ncbi:unnamed protein product [Schistosoma mattheei]|uniref:PWWP domain-containing protein n=1 Tax=Schistosoma mattheei TaxID=31246 RepID=A0AA85BZB6_9TREM|nr:unnamed protein product [Schistosoma mattheei]
MTDRRTSDSSALNSDNEINHYLPKSNFSDQITLATLNGNSQSIRHVTPPIIPKLNEEMKINVDDSSKSEIDSSSDIRSKSKKHFISEQSTKTPESLEPKLVMSKKRKVDVIPDKQKLKKIRLSSQKLTEPLMLLNPLSVTLDSLGPSCSVKDLESRSEVDEILPSDSLDGDFPQKENIPNSISPHLSSPSKEKHSASVQLTCKTSTYGHNSASNNFGVSMSESNFSPQSRRKAFDYEKPKNRWMREARARRCQDERNSNPSSTAASHISTSSNNTDTESSASCNAQSPSLNRLRIRSGDGSSFSPSESTLKSNSNVSSKVKLHNGSLNNRNIESGDASQSEKYLDITDQKSTSHVSPCLTPTSDSSGLALPVIKIKINRNRQPSGCSKTVPTQYEVVKLQTGSHLELATSASKVVSEENSSIANANPSALKLDITCNGLRSPSLSPSASSSKKGSTCESLIISGPLVKRCKLHDGIVFRVGDLVWSKLSGWPYWPAQITSIQRVANEVDLPNSEQVRPVVDFQEQSSPLLTSEQVCYTACLHWFAWNQVSYMPCDKLFHFLEHCKRFDNKKKRGVFRQAVNEAKQAAEKRQETHSTDSESEWDHEVFSSTIHQQSLSQPSEISVLDDAKQLVSQTASSISIPDINLGVEVNATTKQSKHLNNKVRNKTKVSCEKQEPSMLCPSVVDSSNVSLGQSTYNNIGGEVTASTESKLHVISKRRSKQQAKNKVYANTSEDKKLLVEAYNSSLTNNKSNVRLKIILSKPKLKSKLKCAEVLSNNAQNSFENEVNISSSLPNLDVPITNNKIHQIVENSSKEDTESPFTSEIIPESNISTTDSQDFDKTFSATHSELLTQFPHVFPDLKVSGILSDTVDIPTFSEDESEEEDAGRLIIDPDVMASVNVPLSTGNHHYITETLKQDPDVLREDLYSLSSDNMSYNHKLSSQSFDSIHPYSRTSSTTLTQPSMSNFGNPVYSSSDSFTHSFNSSTYSMECLISQPVSVYPTHNQSLIQTVVPRLTTPPILASSVSNLSVPSRSAYFQSNHLNVPSTTTHNVSYVTTEYSTL